MNDTKKPLSKTIPSLLSIAGLYGKDKLHNQIDRYERLVEAMAETPFMAGFSPTATEKTVGSCYFSAPGRTELCGNHTDHNKGRVLAASVDMDTIAYVLPRDDGRAIVRSEGFRDFEVDLSDFGQRSDERGTSKGLVRGLAAALAQGRFSTASSPRGIEQLKGFQACISSSVPPGSGLSSSAAFEVLLGAIISETSGLAASPVELAMVGQYAENEYFGKPSGLQDQMASALGSVVAIDFGGADRPRAQTLCFDPESYGLSLVIVSTGGNHADLTEDYASIPSEMKAVAALFGRPVLEGIGKADLLAKATEIRSSCGDRAFLRAWHFVSETERPLAMAAAMQKGDIAAYLSIVKASGDSSWKYLQNLQSAKNPGEQGLCLALALTEDFLRGEGACRVQGGGFAGAIQAYIPTDRLPAYKTFMEPVFGPDSVLELKIRPYGVVRVEKL